MTTRKKELPAKETALFKQILRQYEFKQYKKGLKAAEQILKKFPEHGETLAMKGLFLNHLDQKAQAYDFVKLGLRHDLMSPICWHVYGLLYRSDKNYEEAMKCYRYALKYDKENLQVLRDFSFLQIQVRDFKGFHETQQHLLKLRPSHRVYWIGLALSYHFLEKHEMALKVLEAYEETSKDRPEGTVDFEHSEFLLFKNQIIAATGNHQSVLDNLSKIESQVCDKRAIKERRLRALLGLNRLDEAQQMAETLVAENPDSFAYIDGLKQARAVSETDVEKLLHLYDELLNKHPRSHALKRLPLDYADGDEFIKRMDTYLRHMFRKGVPSLFGNLKSLYNKRKDKVHAIETLVLDYHRQLTQSGRFSTQDKEQSESPSVVLWVMYFLSQHFDRLGNFTKALHFINEAIEHTPTLLELIMFKGRIFKHMGNPIEAAKMMDDARELDLQDRYINTKATKYWIRCDELSRAETTIGLFTRQGTHEEKMQDLIDMQCIWYALETAESHVRRGHFGRALKRYHQIAKHFDDFLDDQFDFHTYCLRKMTLCAYLNLLKMEDHLHDQHYYKRTARGAISCYILMHENPKYRTPHNEIDGLSEKEKKKLLSKQRRAAAREEQEDPNKGKPSKKKDEDPDGLKLLQTEKPLDEALKFLIPLQSLCPNDFEVHKMSFDIFFRQKKHLLSYKALYHMHRLSPKHPHTQESIVLFFNWIINADLTQLPDTTKEILMESREAFKLNTQADVQSFVENATATAKSDHDVSLILSTLKMQTYIGAIDNRSMLQQLSSTKITADIGLKTALTVWSDANSLPAEDNNDRKASLEKLRQSLNQAFPVAMVFMSETEQLAERMKLTQIDDKLQESSETDK